MNMTNLRKVPLLSVMVLIILPLTCRAFSRQLSSFHTKRQYPIFLRMSSTSSSSSGSKGKLLVLGGTGFLGQTICRRAVLEGYQVTSVSRRGIPPPDNSSSSSSSSTSTASSSSGSSSSSTSPANANAIEYRKGDVREPETVSNILQDGGYVGVVHCIGLLFDDESGLGSYNRLVSGSGSIPDEKSTYDTITRLSAFNAIDAAMEYAPTQQQSTDRRLPFVFTSAAEAGWPDVTGGAQIEQFLAPEWLRRYLTAKRQVEEKLTSDETAKVLRPVIVRPSLIYSLDRPASYVPVGAFFVGNRLGLPFVDRPVTVQSLANAIVRSLSREEVEGVLRYPEIDALNQ